MSLTSYLQYKLLDHLNGLATYTPPPLYLSLHTAPPTDTGSFASEISTVGTGYARQALAAKMGAADAVTGISLNSATITFPVITAEYGTVTHVGICDDLTGGNMCVWGAISEPQNKSIGESYQFTIGQFSLALD